MTLDILHIQYVMGWNLLHQTDCRYILPLQQKWLLQKNMLLLEKLQQLHCSDVME